MYQPPSQLRNSYGFQPVSGPRVFNKFTIQRTTQKNSQPQKNISSLLKNLQSKIQGVQALAQQKKIQQQHYLHEQMQNQNNFQKRHLNQNNNKPYYGLPQQMKGMDLRGSCPNVYKRQNLRNTVSISSQSPIFQLLKKQHQQKSPIKFQPVDLHKNMQFNKINHFTEHNNIERSPKKNNTFVPYHHQQKNDQSTQSSKQNITLSGDYTQNSSKSQVQDSKGKSNLHISNQFTSLNEIIAKKQQLKNILAQKKEEVLNQKTEKQNHTKSKNKIINGFQLGKVLGKGKFGQVFLAKHLQTGFIVAIKKIIKSKVKQYKMIQQLKNEIRLHSALNHPNIVKFFGLFQQNDQVFIIMEYLNGGTLFDYLNEKQTLSIKEAADYLRDTISAIQYLHQKSIAHRDIKPQNIVLSSQGVAKLCDFGWSTLVQNSRKTYCGTFDYAPPQILQRRNYDQSVDIWCIGILTYQLLTGRVPFEGQKRNDIMQKIINVDKNKLQFPNDMDADARQFIESLVRKDPEQRPKSKDLLKFGLFVNNPVSTQKKKGII